MTHALTRTSPKGPDQTFVGRCTKCGMEGLQTSDALEPCPADGLVSDTEALINCLDELSGEDQMRTAIAYCWASGEIEVSINDEGFELPEGTILFARGYSDALNSRLVARARHGHEEGVLLVPGLPELDDDGEDAVEVLCRWIDWAFGDWVQFGSVRVQPEAV